MILNQAKENFTIKNFNKSLDISDFDLSFVRGLSVEDGSATITNFTAYLIAQGINHVANITKSNNGTYLICGGGRKNNYLVDSINDYLTDKKIKLKDIDKFNFDGDFIESQTFGYLAIRSFIGLPISFPETTRCLTPTNCGVLNENF
mgnify:FL=1